MNRLLRSYWTTAKTNWFVMHQQNIFGLTCNNICNSLLFCSSQDLQNIQVAFFFCAFILWISYHLLLSFNLFKPLIISSTYFNKSLQTRYMPEKKYSPRAAIHPLWWGSLFSRGQIKTSILEEGFHQTNDPYKLSSFGKMHVYVWVFPKIVVLPNYPF